MASGSAFYDTHKDLFEFERYSTIQEHSKTGAILQQADVAAISPFSPGRKGRVFVPDDESQTIRVDVQNVLADDNEGIYDKSQADMRHRQYIKRLEDSSKKSQVDGFDNLLTKGVNAAHSHIGNAVYGSPKRNIGKMLGVSPQVITKRDGNSGSHEHRMLSDEQSAINVVKAPLPQINVPNVTDIDLGKLNIANKAEKEKNSQQYNRHIPPVSNNLGKETRSKRTPQKPEKPAPTVQQRPSIEDRKNNYTEYSSPAMQRRAIIPRDGVKHILNNKNHPHNPFFTTGKKQVKPLLSPRLESIKILPLNAEQVPHRNCKKLIQPQLTSRNEHEHHLWADLRNNPSAKPTTGMFNPDLPSRKMYQLPSSENERLDVLKKTRFLLDYCGGKAFTGYETDMPTAVVNRLNAYRRLAARKDMLRKLYENDISKQRLEMENQLRNWF